MKLLKVSFDGMKMFKDGKLALDFFATDRVADQKGVALIEKPICSKNVVALAGINAAGKSSPGARGAHTAVGASSSACIQAM